MPQLLQEIKLLIESASFDEDRLNYFTCPECHKERKLMVARTEDGGIFWRCLSASCPTHGAIRESHLHAGERKPKARAVRSYIQGRAMEHEDWDLLGEYVAGLYGRIEGDVVCVPNDFDSDISVGYAIRGPLGELRGHIVRHYGPSVPRKHKADTYPYVATGPLLGWGSTAGPVIVIVEDMASMLSLDRYDIEARPVALLGTSLSMEGAREIAAQRPDLVLIALDNDATDKAIALRRQYSGVFGCHTRVIPLRREDIKDMHPEDVLHWYQMATGGH